MDASEADEKWSVGWSKCDAREDEARAGDVMR
jgi:hypothetical protein